MERISTHHFCMDIKGFIRNARKDRDYAGVFQHDDGRAMSIGEAKIMLHNALVAGKKVLPCGPCEGFSYQTGCPGHPQEAAPIANGSQPPKGAR